jgi:hypothetical protein
VVKSVFQEVSGTDQTEKERAEPGKASCKAKYGESGHRLGDGRGVCGIP